jgi:hypothetical protein
MIRHKIRRARNGSKALTGEIFADEVSGGKLELEFADIRALEKSASATAAG